MLPLEPKCKAAVVFDIKAQRKFEYLMPELANTVYEYLPAGPGAVRFVTRNGNAYLWYMKQPILFDRDKQKWVLECLGPNSNKE